ncbi:MAG: hypothetical protein GY943_30495 [Chloroflexi bacterium]|nr:hypothetical protein [Chloroflexota bacterium]
MKTQLQRKNIQHPKITPAIIDRHDWYCLVVVGGREFFTQDLLRMRGLLTYVPVRKDWRHKNRYDKANGKKHLISYPQMTGYVLVGFALEQLSPEYIPHWLRLFQIPVILSVVGIAQRPIQLDRESLKRFASQHPNGMQAPLSSAHMRTHGEFKIGDMVRVCSGPFDGHIVPVTGIRGRKAKFEIELFGSIHEPEIDCFELEGIAA